MTSNSTPRFCGGRTAIGLLAAALFGCGGATLELPPEDTLTLMTPDESAAAAKSQALCAGDSKYESEVKQRIIALRENVAPYLEMYRKLRNARLDRLREAGGEVSKTWKGPGGRITVIATAEEDGTVTYALTAALKALGEDNERRLLDGWVAPDNSSGGWKVFGLAGQHVRSIDWEIDENGDVRSEWKDEIWGYSALWERSGDDAHFLLTGPFGGTHDVSWTLSTGVGNVTVTLPDGTVHLQHCWDETFCSSECS